MVEATHPGSRKAWYLLHSWCGIVMALLLFVVCTTGCVALFFHELQPWQHPELRHVPPALHGRIDFARILDEAGRRGLIRDAASLELPRHTHAVVLRLPDAPERIAIFAPDGTFIAVKAEGFTRFLRRLHTDLLLPFPYGAYLVGLLGIVLLFLVCTGVVTHRRFYRDMFTLRRGRNWRLGWSDVHKLLGSWGALFQAITGFTGALLGLAGLLLLQTAVVAHRGDAGSAYAALVGNRPAASGVPARLGDIDPMLAPEINGDPFVPRYVTIRHLGDRNATVIVEGERPGYLSGTERKVYDASGRLLSVERGVDNGAGWRVYSALLPLHFGDFGGTALKIVYLVLGIGASLMPVTGTLLWLDRHRHDGAYRRSYWILSRIAVGVAAGLPVGMAALFVADKLAPSWLIQSYGLGTVLFGAWGAALAWTIRRTEAKRALRELLCAAGVLLAAAVMANGWTSGEHVLRALEQPLTVVHAADALMLLLATSFVACARRLTRGVPPAGGR